MMENQKTSQNSSYRSLFLLRPDVIFLNHGSFGATPLPVFKRYQYWQRELERQPVEFLGRKAKDLLLQSRKILAEYLHTQPGNLVYVTNATTGLNIIARSLNLCEHDEVLSTDHEYGALDRTWRFLAQKRGFKYINQPVNLPVETPDQIIADLFAGVSSRTKVIFISHITSPTAIIFPVKAVCHLARQKGILTIVDGAHTPGQIDLNLEEIGADFYVGNLHKWLCAPKGSAFIYARPEIQHLIEPLIVSWGWESETPGESPFVDYLEWSGTRDISAFLAVPDAIQFQRQLGWEKLRIACHHLASMTRQAIIQITGEPPLYPDDLRWYVQMGSVPLPEGVDPLTLQRRLYEEFKIEIPVTHWRDRYMIRFSLQIYNDETDIHALIKALSVILGKA
ncbi:MAG: aminotransferase class V-fold PLP-dependent enzyme [Bellilinea sp.]|nr:aminotransferase class V-fold PLP-dependent enzyme [Bellilinea sp.]